MCETQTAGLWRAFPTEGLAGMTTDSNIHVLHPPAPPLAAFLRIGYTGHQKLEALHAAGRFPYRRAVFDASHVYQQDGLVRLLKGAGCEIVLDLNFAEAATPGRFASAVSKLPWGNPERPWQPSDFSVGTNTNFPELMAKFAVQAGADAVLAPTHVEEGEATGWHAIDHAFCHHLRAELDRSGGAHIAIDYQLITTARVLKDSQQLTDVTSGIADLPIQNIWLRASGFGATATGAGTRHLIEAARSLHPLGYPLVIDMAGGFPGLATLAFGVAAGISHGVAQKETFSLSEWRTLPTPQQHGGVGRRVYVPELDRYLKEDQFRAFFAIRGTKSRFGCADTSCCRNGIDDMLENSHTHFITQRTRQIEDLSRIPEARRAEYFLLHQLDHAIRSSRYAAKLKFADEGVQTLVTKAKDRLFRLRDALGALNEADAGATSRSRALVFRGGSGTKGAADALLGKRP
jgi:hypothetical protein